MALVICLYVHFSVLAMHRLNTLTRYWPLVISETILFNIPEVELV
jgi:hypothetical protein